jgi:hypothetical protein
MTDDGVISPGQAEALARYGHARLAGAIRHVTSSEQETDSYLAHAAAAGRKVR